jgi:hypothetical protein
MEGEGMKDSVKKLGDSLQRLVYLSGAMQAMAHSVAHLKNNPRKSKAMLKLSKEFLDKSKGME